MPKPLLCPPELLTQNLQGKTYLVTGGSAGIGLATVRQLASQGATVVIACRNLSQGEAAKAELLAQGLRGTIDVLELDLAELASVRRFAAKFEPKYARLDGLVNNAGVMNTPQQKTKDGFEMQFGVNHLGHFLLTELLLPLLKKSVPARIVNLSSCYHDKAMGREGRIDFNDLQFENRKYDGWVSYAQSKLANLLYAKELAERLAGSGVTAVSVHPGWVRTNLIRHSLPVWAQDYLLRPVLRAAGMIEPFEGIQSTLFALLSPTVPSQPGAFFSQTGMYRDRALNRGGWPLVSPNPAAHDLATAKRLTEVSRKLVQLDA
jgi:NAD(P)-dependent dehydrogenase (short-subunit alcohol dehydrogenase family)